MELSQVTTLTLPSNFQIQLEASICQDSLYDFVVEAWHVVEQEPFVDGWHIKLLCEALQALYEDRIESNFLIINIPPRHMKSLLVDVFFPAWIWTKEPHKKFLATSYAENLIGEHAGKCKKLVNSPWYQERFNVPMAVSPDTNLRFANQYGGYVYGFGFGGAITGQGGDFLLIDDPLKTTEADSKPVREKVNTDYDNAVANRLNDFEKGKRVLIMQRLHEGDLVGHLVSKGISFEHIVLPFEYEGERFQSSIGLKDPRTEAGEILWKERWTSEQKLRDYKLTYSGDRARAGQLQQRPAPAGGFIFKRDWFPRVSRPSNVVGVFHSWDTAQSISPDASYSCGIVGELTADYRLFIGRVVRKRLLFPQLQEEIENLANEYKGVLSAVIIENKSSGIQAVQTLKQSSPGWLAEIIIPFNPKGDKDARQYQAASYCEKECVLFPFPSQEVAWLKDFEDEIFMTPSSAYRDQSDALAQLIIYLRHFLSDGWRARTGNQLKVQSLEGVL